MAEQEQSRSLSKEKPKAAQAEKQPFLERLRTAVRDELHLRGYSANGEEAQHVMASALSGAKGMESRINISQVVQDNADKVTGGYNPISQELAALAAQQTQALRSTGVTAGANHNFLGAQPIGTEQQRGGIGGPP